jgi:hypothetical protein
MWGRVKFKDFSRTFKVMCQQIQGLNTEEKGLAISKIWRWIFATLMSFSQPCSIWTCKINSTKCPFWMPNNFRKYPKTRKQEKFKDFQVLLYKFKALNFCFQIQGHWMTFKYEPCEKPSKSYKITLNLKQKLGTNLKLLNSDWILWFSGCKNAVLFYTAFIEAGVRR